VYYAESYDEFIVQERMDIIREVQEYCADTWERNEGADAPWVEADAKHVAELLNKDKDPWGLFAFMDEKTGHSIVGYKTRDGREWFHILRQMRNTRDSGLFEYLRKGPAS
jgi:hypothetical protein